MRGLRAVYRICTFVLLCVAIVEARSAKQSTFIYGDVWVSRHVG